MSKHYIEAFEQFSGAKRDEFKYEEYENTASAEWMGAKYAIVQRDDIIHQLTGYFENEQYLEIGLDLPPGLLSYVYSEELDHVSESDLLIALYREWNAYWYSCKKTFASEQTFQDMRTSSWEELVILIETIRLDSSKFVENAVNLNDDFIPVIAMTFKRLYGDDEKFIDDCATYLLEYGDELLAYGETFSIQEVRTEGQAEGEGEFYYIYCTEPSYSEMGISGED